ncbi:hypothetical protein ACHAWF_004958 [Thalassiosira exigua]
MTMTTTTTQRQRRCFFLLLAALGALSAVSFRSPVSSSGSFVGGHRNLAFDHTPISPTTHNIVAARCRKEGSTTLQCALLPSAVAKISPPVRNTLLLGSAAALIYKNRRKFYPGSSPDPAFSEPLPEGSLGCPLIGNISFFTKAGDAKTGAGKFYRWMASKSGSPKVFKIAPLGKPTVIVSGMKSVRGVFNQEFKAVKTGVMTDKFSRLFGGESLLFTTDQARHQFMRRLVGQSMTPEAINDAMPALIKGATEQINTLTLDEPVEMERTLTGFTLDVAWRQILGLDLKDDEIETFYNAVNDWIGGILSPLTMLLPGLKHTKAGKAYSYLVSQIERKMGDLEKNGPDGSTLSGMYFAKDEEDPSKSLSRDDVISNSLLLILAGSETAASTLTVATLALGLHKDVLKKLKEEQLTMMAKHEGKTMTRDMLEEDCPYLDAVVKETMRVKPLATTGALRFAQETIVVDGKQIPKGFGVGFNPYITHSLDPAVKEDDDSHMDIVKGFRPERWLDDKTKPTEYMPFGVGPRYCLGVNLAMAEMKVFLALFARRVEFDMTNTTANNVEWKKISIIPKPADGALISVSSLSENTVTVPEAVKSLSMG